MNHMASFKIKVIQSRNSTSRSAQAIKDEAIASYPAEAPQALVGTGQALSDL